MKLINKKRVFDLVEKGAMLVDMRSPVDFRDGTIPKAINLPLKNFLNKITGIQRNQKIIIFGKSISDQEIKSACNYAEQLGFEYLYVTEYKQLAEEMGA